MKTVILQSQTGVHLGFLLCAIPPADLEGDCIFIIVPDQAEMLEDPEVQALLERKKRRESQIELGPDRRSAIICTEGLEDMFVELDASGEGSWGYLREEGRSQVGKAAVIDKP